MFELRGARRAVAAPRSSSCWPTRRACRVTGELTIGRAPGSTLQLADPTVSRAARADLLANGAGALLEDAGSSHGTFLDGQRVTGAEPLRDGAKIRLGDAELCVERRRDSAEAGRTIVVKAGASLIVPAAGGAASVAPSATQFGLRPRVRSGYALKRLDAEEGARRWVLKDLERRHLPAALGHRRAAVRAARRHAHAGRADRRGRPALRVDAGRRGSRGCCPTSASAASSPA